MNLIYENPGIVLGPIFILFVVTLLIQGIPTFCRYRLKKSNEKNNEN